MQEPREQIFTPVISSRVFQHDKNAAFYMILDEYQRGTLDHAIPRDTYQSIQFCTTSTSEYVLFHMPIEPVDFPIFPGYKLSRLHVRIDLLLTKIQDDGSVKKLDPNHVTMVFSNAASGQHITVHLYCNHMGNPVQTSPFHVDASEKITLSQLQEDFLYQQAQTSQALLQVIVRHKNKQQSMMRMRMEGLQTALATVQGDVAEERKVIESLIRLAQDKNRYSCSITGEERYYQHVLQALNKSSEVPVATALDTTPVSDTAILPECKATPVASKTPPKQNVLTEKQKQQEQHQAITRFIDALLRKGSPTEFIEETVVLWCINNIEALKTLNLLMLRATSKQEHVKKFIAAQWRRLPIEMSLFNYFSKHLSELNIEAIRQLSPYMEDTYELFDLYHHFLTSIEQGKDLEKQQQQIEIAHVLHATSDTYNQILIAKQYQLSCMQNGSEEGLFLGVLARMMYSENLHAFKMYLEQGISTEHVQWILATIPYNALGGLVAFFAMGPRVAIFLDVLLPYTRNITSAHVEHVNLLPYTIDGAQIQCTYKGGYSFLDNGRKQKIPLKDLSQQKMTPLGFAIKQLQRQPLLQIRGHAIDCTHYPALILKIGQSRSPEILIQETMRLFENSEFYTLYSNNGSSVSPTIFSSMNEVTEESDNVVALAKTHASSYQKLSLSFAMVELSEHQPSTEKLGCAAQYLLTACIKVFQESTSVSQTQMIQNFYQLSMLAMKRQDVSEFLYLTRATLFCCISMQEPSCQVHEIALKTVLLFSNMVKNNNKEMSQGVKTLAASYFDGLSSDDQATLSRDIPMIVTRIKGDKDKQRLFSSSTGHASSSETTAVLKRSHTKLQVER